MCFCAGLVLTLVMVFISIAGPAMSTGLFVRALTQHVNKAAIAAEDDELAAFGRETMQYLKGQKEAWEPQIPAA